MPTDTELGRWTGWWEGVVDLVPPRGGNRDFSIQSLFKKGLPKPFPEADQSVLTLIMPGSGGVRTDREPDRIESRWLDGRRRQAVHWDLLDSQAAGSNINFSWDDEGSFRYRELKQGPLADFSSDFCIASGQRFSNR